MREHARQLDRVRKLLALAQSPNVHEAAAAAAAAQTLIEEYRLHGLLDQDAEEEVVTDGRGEPLEVARRLRRWKTLLAGGLARINGCTAYTVTLGKERHVLIAGRDEDREAIRALFSWLVQKIEWLSATHGKGQDRSWHNAFRVGACEVVVQRLGEAQNQARATLSTTAMSVVTPALERRREAVDAFVADRLKLKRGRRLRVDAAGYERGREEGSRLSLDRESP
jgi:hypothetical protein